MLEKELEILKHIEELYNHDIGEAEFALKCQGKESQIEAWKKAFAEYYLIDIIDAIDDFYVKKSSKTRPNIAQLLAMMKAKNVKPISLKNENNKVVPDYALQYQKQDKEEGNMHWLVPEYEAVWRKIQNGGFPFVYDFNKPTHEEFRECMKRHSLDKFGRWYQCESENDIKAMSEEQKQAILQEGLEAIKNFKKTMFKQVWE